MQLRDEREAASKINQPCKKSKEKDKMKETTNGIKEEWRGSKEKQL